MYRQLTDHGFRSQVSEGCDPVPIHCITASALDMHGQTKCRNPSRCDAAGVLIVRTSSLDILEVLQRIVW